jgi:signal transduction histidine kinase
VSVSSIGPHKASHRQFMRNIAVYCDAALGMMHADQMRLRQPLLNLMSNSNKFTEKGTISIAARQGQENDRDWITLAVTDIRWANCSRLLPRRPVSTGAPDLVW